MEDKKTIIDKSTLIPLGLVLVLASGIWFASSLNSKVKMNTGRVESVEIKVSSTPTRNEFNDLKDDITEIKKDIKTLLIK